MQIYCTMYVLNKCIWSCSLVFGLREKQLRNDRNSAGIFTQHWSRSDGGPFCSSISTQKRKILFKLNVIRFFSVLQTFLQKPWTKCRFSDTFHYDFILFIQNSDRIACATCTACPTNNGDTVSQKGSHSITSIYSNFSPGISFPKEIRRETNTLNQNLSCGKRLHLTTRKHCYWCFVCTQLKASMHWTTANEGEELDETQTAQLASHTGSPTKRIDQIACGAWCAVEMGIIHAERL